MHSQSPHPAAPGVLQELIGYLNLSSGASDPQFLRNLSELYQRIEAAGHENVDAWRVVHTLLIDRLGTLEGTSAAFNDLTQARSVIGLVFEHFVPRYRQYHRDLLFHQPEWALWRPFLLGRAFEAILRQGSPWDEVERIIETALDELNDYIGHRPVAILNRDQRIEPYPHEWVRPVPLYIRTAGVAVGRYHKIIEAALSILRATDPGLLTQAYFDPELLDELAFDPRAYDFDHPVNKRPNYHFGQWDPHHLDGQGRYRRFVLQQVTIDGLLERVAQPGDLPADELLYEAAAVLAGTILMASGTCGSSPETHDSGTTLSTLVPKIAAYRDQFYQRLVAQVPGSHGERLRAEAVTGRQPLAAARQHLNHYLARRRATQLERVHLALIFARLGYPEAALRQAHIVPVAAARIMCEIQCRISTGHLAVELGHLEQAVELLPEIEDFLHRGIECGALVDPWNILGFQGQFSLFPSPENSVPDHRVDHLITLLEQVFGVCARLWSEAAARNQERVQKRCNATMSNLARWWDQFASTTVDGVDGFSGAEAYESARQVAGALEAWHQGGAAAGDIAFWRKHVNRFQSTKAYALVVEALLEKHDSVAAMALLMQWLAQAGGMPLKQGEYSFHALAKRLLRAICRNGVCLSTPAGAKHDRAAMVGRFFDYLEANAEDFWQAPHLELEPSLVRHESVAADGDEENEDDHDLYNAAYDQVVYIDSTDDGNDAEMLESGAPATNFELEAESRRVRERLAFLSTVAGLWKVAALASIAPEDRTLVSEDQRQRWLEQTEVTTERLSRLLAEVNAQRIAAPTATRDSLMEFDRRRNIKDNLLETIIATAVETAHAGWFLQATGSSELGKRGDASSEITFALLRAVLAGDTAHVRLLWPECLRYLAEQPLLYVPIGKGGDPRQIVQVRFLQQTLQDLLRWLPRLGLLRETCQLLETARQMEMNHPVGAGAVTEFDRIFSVGYKSLVKTLVAVSQDWPAEAADGETRDNRLVECLEQLTEMVLKPWLEHSRTLRLSVLERVSDDKNWQPLVKFIETYGHDLFTQRFLNMGNLRAILHQGVDSWLAHLAEDPESHDEYLLVRDLDGKLSRADAAKHLSVVIEAVVENYTEYRDYNTTTTQSDRGELIYMLLDFLRLRVQYDRVAWHLRPVLLAHEILVRRGRTDAAELWRRSLADRTSEVADTLERRGAELRKRYGVRLPTVSDRLAERFVRPLAIDRARALVQPAIDEVRQHLPPVSFQMLQEETEELAQEPTGVGLDVPAWLQELEEEVEDARWGTAHPGQNEDSKTPLPQSPVSLAEVQRQLSEGCG